MGIFQELRSLVGSFFMVFIADSLTTIRIAVMARHDYVVLPVNKIVYNILLVFRDNGFIEDIVDVESEDFKKKVKVVLKKTRPINSIRMISKPGRRVFSGYLKFPRFLNGFGLVVVSTSCGVMSAREAVKRKVGGEILCSIY